MNVAETIKTARDALGMTQEDLAEKLEVSRQAVSKWELGTSEPSPENLAVLADVLGVEFPEEADELGVKLPEEKEAPDACRKSSAWKFAAIALGILMLSALVSIGFYMALKAKRVPDTPILTGVYWFTEDGTPLRPDLGDGWCSFEAGSRVLLVASFQNGLETEVDAIALYLTPTGTETFDQREQLAVQSITYGREFALFAMDIPESMMGHLEIVLECTGGTTIEEMVNITSVS